MTDIVQKLRLVDPTSVLLAAPPHDTSYVQVGLVCHEAAAEIERLRAEVLAEREACAQIAIERADELRRLLVEIERLGAEVRAEREACAQIVEPSADLRREPEWYIGGEDAVELLIELAAEIRAR